MVTVYSFTRSVWGQNLNELYKAGCGNNSSSKATKSNRNCVMHILFTLVLVLALSCTTSLTSTRLQCPSMACSQRLLCCQLRGESVLRSSPSPYAFNQCGRDALKNSELKVQLARADKLALTTDCSIALTSKSYITTTFHFIFADCVIPCAPFSSVSTAIKQSLEISLAIPDQCAAHCPAPARQPH